MIDTRRLALVAGVATLLASNAALPMSDETQQCLLERLEQADDTTTVAELKSACSEKSAADLMPSFEEQRESAVGIRLQADADARSQRFVISTNKANYFMATYNADPNVAPYGIPDDTFDKEEMKFQVSFKMPLATDLFDGNADLVFAYTSTAWWQLFNSEIDNPFRETNYEPEVLLQGQPEKPWFGLDVLAWDVGINHQSNGQSGALSRGWDRLVAGAAIGVTDDIVVGLRGWTIVRRQDTNADLWRYMGYGDIGLGWVPNRNTFALKYRPAREGDAVELTWSYPISKYLRLYAQYWNGYGESLIDYNVRTKRFGLGIALSDILARD